MSYDTKFLDTESELRSYFLGLFMADGWIDNKGGVHISLVDKQIIDDLVVATNYTNKVLNIVRKNNFGIQNMYRISYYKLYDKMKALGFIEKKTGNEFIPERITYTFHHFLRGLSDGDGCLHFEQRPNKKYLNWEVICSSKEFLDKIIVNINTIIGPNNIKVHIRSGTNFPVYRIRCNKHNEAIKICELMYSNCLIKLERKFQVYQEAKLISVKEVLPWTEEEINLIKLGIDPPNRGRKSIREKRKKLIF